MRMLFILFFATFSLPILAWDETGRGWDAYYNRSWGYDIDIPPSFLRQDGSSYSYDDDGDRFVSKSFSAELIVWGDHLVIEDGGFEQEVIWRIAADIERGWNISYQATSPQWASYSGLNSDNSRILYQRMIPFSLCDGKGYAAFRLEYDRADRARFDSIIKRLVSSFKESFARGWFGDLLETKCSGERDD